MTTPTACQCSGCIHFSPGTPSTPCLHPNHKPGECPGKQPKE